MADEATLLTSIGPFGPLRYQLRWLLRRTAALRLTVLLAMT